MTPEQAQEVERISGRWSTVSRQTLKEAQKDISTLTTLVLQLAAAWLEPPTSATVTASGTANDPFVLSEDENAEVYFAIGGREARHLVAMMRPARKSGDSSAIEIHAQDATAEDPEMHASLFLTGKVWDASAGSHKVATLELENKVNPKTKLPEFWVEIPAGSPGMRGRALGPNHSAWAAHDQPGSRLSLQAPKHDLTYQTVATCESDPDDPYIAFDCVPMFRRARRGDNSLMVRLADGSRARIRLEPA